ncbi:extracellular solute-binding protein [Phytoactinopolyspora mesophila]|uniref:Extracellular solute-binding protein n=1 Tax=Phytoactinopolyspora mesophila TaxID=2650750 RepID=A0A7K3M3L5_9ACTN|nr:extracellular solute-binding protein [Phytoactinopolyspora mesophila]NDL57836.1 extracellular solute-binding protein [Phytoactinopolyspora mesophila]
MKTPRTALTRLTVMIAGAALLAAGCGNDDDNSVGTGDGQSIRLVVAQYTEGTQPYWEEFIEEFEAEHPGTSVELQVIDWGNLRSQVNTMIQTQQIPDLLNINLFADYAEADLLYRADEVMSDEQLADFVPAFAENASYDGTQYAFPFVATVNGMYYNATILEEAGLDGPPETWDEFRDAAEKIADLPGDYVPYALALGSEGGTGEFGTWARSNDGDWMIDGEWTINGDRNVETLEFLAELSEDGLTQPNPGQTNRADGTWPLFAQGRAAMVYASFGTRAFMGPVEESGIEFGVATHPTNNDAEPSTHGIQDYLMAFRKEDNQQAVSDFLAYFYQPENYAEYLRVEGLLPTTESGANEFRDDDEFGQYVELLEHARFDPAAQPVWAELRGTLDSDLGTGVAPNADPQELLDRIQSIAEAGL